MSAPLLEFTDVSKSFSGISVLRNISLSLDPGQTLGLVGENGAGKSTLMNILGGNLRPDGGQMRWRGKPYAPRDPEEAAQQGIAFVHQELNLFPNLSIAENLFLRAFPRRGWRGFALIDRARCLKSSETLLAQVGLSVSPEMMVEDLSAGERQLVEIAKALSAEAQLIILDEPTTSLASREAEHLFGLLRFLRERGVAMIYISHNLRDIVRLSDTVAVLRDGAVASFGPRAHYTVDQLVSQMVGRELGQMFPPRLARPTPEKVLEVRRVSQPGIVHEITFHLHGREVLGLAGLMGSGRSELARILFGLDPFASGEILLQGRPLPRLNPRQSIERGLAFLTEDRRDEGLCLEASIRDNVALAALPQFARLPLRLINRRQQDSAVARLREAVRLTKSARSEQPVKTLSGGNQQKVVLAKWLLRHPTVFILDEPTRGIDVGAKTEIYQLINELSAQGAGILVISSELDELIGLCDRILVLNRGEMRDELWRPEFDRERILRAALHDRPESG